MGLLATKDSGSISNWPLLPRVHGPTVRWRERLRGDVAFLLEIRIKKSLIDVITAYLGAIQVARE
jgi:hypothetical protein